MRLTTNTLMAFFSLCLLMLSTSLLANQELKEQADLVVVEKSKSLLSVYHTGKLLASYPVAFGGNPQGTKQQEGDKKTPEGKYLLDYKLEKSGYYKAFHVSYPNAADIENAKKLGVSPGSAIMVHGQKNGFGWAAPIVQKFNWTKGCIALSNDDIDQLWEIVPAKTPIEIKP